MSKDDLFAQHIPALPKIVYALNITIIQSMLEMNTTSSLAGPVKARASIAVVPLTL